MKRSSGKQARRAKSRAESRPRASSTKAEPRSRIRLDVDERRAQLVELGLVEFGSRTYEEVSIDLIAQSAEISKGLLYHYFPTKRAFYVACVREAAARLIARMDEVPEELAPLEGLRVGLDSYLEYVRAHGRAYATLMRGGVGVDREIATVVDETRAMLLDRLTSGMTTVFPTLDAAPGSSLSLLRIALHGWIGLAEATSIAWVEACVEAESHASPAPAAAEVRDLLAQAFVTIVQSTLKS